MSLNILVRNLVDGVSLVKSTKEGGEKMGEKVYHTTRG